MVCGRPRHRSSEARESCMSNPAQCRCSRKREPFDSLHFCFITGAFVPGKYSLWEGTFVRYGKALVMCKTGKWLTLFCNKMVNLSFWKQRASSLATWECHLLWHASRTVNTPCSTHCVKRSNSTFFVKIISVCWQTVCISRGVYFWFIVPTLRFFSTWMPACFWVRQCLNFRALLMTCQYYTAVSIEGLDENKKNSSAVFNAAKDGDLFKVTDSYVLKERWK